MATTATEAAATQRTTGLRRFRFRNKWRTAVTGRNAIYVARTQVRAPLMLDLDDVLGVLLAAVRQVEAAGKNVVVGDQHFRVHEVVDGPLCPRSRALGPELHRRDDVLERLDLPGSHRALAPLTHHLVHLSRVVHPRDVETFLHDLGQGAEHGSGG